MERLLRYSYEHARVIRLMYFDEESKLRQVNATVISYDDQKVEFVSTRSPRVIKVAMENILSVDFRRGDDGMTL